MSRLQKKCLIASGAMHLVLLMVLVVTSAFAVKKQEIPEQQILNFVPDELVDAALQQAAGRPAAHVQPTPQPPVQHQEAPPPEPKPPEPRPETHKQVRETKPPPPKVQDKKPEPVEEKPKVEKAKPEPKPEPPPKPKAVPVKVDLSQRIVRSNDDAIRRQREAREAEARARAEAQRKQFEAQRDRALSEVSSLASKLTTPTVGASSVDFGTVGVSYASYDSWVRKVYMDAWTPPNDLPAGNPIVLVKVVIRKDGTIESAVISDPSGVSKLDRNIRSLLARVKTIGRPFPAGAHEEQRTYTIEFNLKAINGGG